MREMDIVVSAALPPLVLARGMANDNPRRITKIELQAARVYRVGRGRANCAPRKEFQKSKIRGRRCRRWQQEAYGKHVQSQDCVDKLHGCRR